MIVSCPACATDYSHSAPETHQVCRCSQCDERFPLAAAKRSYRVLPGGLAKTDPLLAAGVESTQTQVDLPLQQEATVAPVVAAPAPQSESGDTDYFASGTDDEMALFGFDVEPEEDEQEDVEPQADVRPDRPAHPVREALGVFLLAGLGGAAGFEGSLKFGVEPVEAIAMGLGMGLTLGWAWIRWAERKR